MCTVTDRIILERGVPADYQQLARFHYRGRPCAAFTRIWRARDMATNATAGVAVETMPCLACGLRDVATAGRYRLADRSESARRINRDFRTIGRVIVHPAYRGAGLAVALVKEILNHAETPYVEALAVMGHVHPFFEKAGMRRWLWPRDGGRVRPVYYLWIGGIRKLEN